MALRLAIGDGIEELRANRLRTALQFSGVALGVASVITALALMAGERAHDLDTLEKRGGARRLDVRPKNAGWTALGEDTKAPFTLEDLAAIRRDLSDRIEAINAAEVIFDRVETERHSRDRNVSGVLPEYPVFNDFYAEEGRFLTWADMDQASRVCVLGWTCKSELFGAGDAIGRSVRIKGEPYQVVGVMQRKELHWNKFDNSNALEWMNRLTLVPLSTVHKRVTGKSEIATFQVMAKQADDVPKLQEALRVLLWRRHHRKEDFMFVARQRQFEKNQQAKMAYNLVFFGVGAISLIVGGMVIMNILLASLSSRIREIGVKKAIGAKPLDLFVQFLVEAVGVAFAGSVAGCLVGGSLSSIVADFANLHSALPFWVVFTSVFSAVFVGLAFGIYPAIKAARVTPVEALRYE